MINTDKLEDVIRSYVSLQPVPSGTGWYPVLCKVCNDHGRKGFRGGFKFDGDVVAYQCFNCGHSAVYDPTTSKTMPPRMVTVLDSFGIPQDDWQPIIFNNLKRYEDNNLTATKYNKTVNKAEPVTLEFPSNFYLLSQADADDKWAKIALLTLASRGVDPNSYPFMLATSSPEDPRLNKWRKRIIIPVHKDERLIFYTGRDLTGKALKKYESPSVIKSNIIYGYDRLFVDMDMPLYVTEGWFDAYSVDGVAIFGNTITDEQIYWLNRSPRQKVYVPDRFGKGIQAALQALELGWSISTPDIGSDCKDVNDAVVKYGKLYTLKSLAENTTTGFEAQVRLSEYCK